MEIDELANSSTKVNLSCGDQNDGKMANTFVQWMQRMKWKKEEQEQNKNERGGVGGERMLEREESREKRR